MLYLFYNKPILSGSVFRAAVAKRKTVYNSFITSQNRSGKGFDAICYKVIKSFGGQTLYHEKKNLECSNYDSFFTVQKKIFSLYTLSAIYFITL